MRIFALFLCSLTVFGQINNPATPANHVWSDSGALTSPSSDGPVVIGQRYIQSVAGDYGLSESDLTSIYLVKEYRSSFNGVTHLLFRQQFDGIDVLGSNFTVNIDSAGQVLNAGGKLYGRPSGAAPTLEAAGESIRVAFREVNPRAESSYLPARTSLAKGEKTMNFIRGGFADNVNGQPVWFPVGKGLRAAWAFFVPNEDEAIHFRTVVDAEKQSILQNTPLGGYQAPQPPRGLVFPTSPQPNPRPGTLVISPRPYVDRVQVSFAGDPQASPRGWVDGAETAGNNTVTGQNPNGTFSFTPETAKSPTRDFSFPLELGPGKPNPTNFKDAATTNLFYLMNRAHDFFWHIGVDEAAGSFQQDNFGRGGVAGDPIYAYSQFGITRPGVALIDNASFSFRTTTEDGAPGFVRMYLAGDHADNIFTDGSFDADVVIHEYTHGISGRLARNLFETYQGRAMSEAWSDFFALEMLLPEGAPLDGAYATGEYFIQSFGAGDRSRPYSTNMSVNGLTFADYGRVADIGLEEHFDGEIWFEAMWEARANLIKLYGEREGRRRIQRNAIEGMKLQPPNATMVETRDAIILANRVNFRGEGEQALWEGFAKRGLGVLAQSRNGDSSYVVPSFETPSNTGILKFHSPSYVPNERVHVSLYDANNTSQTALIQLTTSNGDLEHMTLRRRGLVYEGSIISANDAFVGIRDEFLDTIPSDFISAYYNDPVAASGGSQLVQVTVPVQPEYTFTLRPGATVVSGTESAQFTVPTGGRFFLTYRKVNLPFPFRFFDRTHRSMYINGNGNITFMAPNVTACNDSNSVASVIAIAPMWMDLVYGGQAQSGENVYFSTGPDSVSVRWAAETVFTGEPVNFSVVLYRDGRILYQYGAGNNNLVNTDQFGCATNSPVVGLSAGRDSYQLRYFNYDGLPYLERAPSVLIDPPFDNPSDPVVRIESPEVNGSYGGVLAVRGIAYDPEIRITRLDLLIDGVARGMIQINQSRPDICGAERLPGCPNIGFLRNVDLTAFGLKPGVHRLQIRATNSRGSTMAYPEQPISFNFEGGGGREPQGAIEMPEDGATISANTPIRGYAYATDLRVTAVAILIDGVNYGTATYGLRRDDICNSLEARAPNCPGIGFQFSLNTVNGAVQLPNGRHLLQIRVTDESDRFTLIPSTPLTITVENAENRGPVGQITFPSPNGKLSGTVKLRGWAYDPDGTVASIDFVVGLRVIGNLRYGIASPEACAALTGAMTDVAACPNIGFEGDFDTTLLNNGQHLFYVRVRDNQGRTTMLPDPTYVGMNIIIEN